jgi:hypothetical protein
MPVISKTSLFQELQLVASAQQIPPFPQLVSDPELVALGIEFIMKNGLFEDFCARLLEDTQLMTALFGHLDIELVIDSQSLSTADVLIHSGNCKLASARGTGTFSRSGTFSIGDSWVLFVYSRCHSEFYNKS